jgi:hypothetical protein
VKISSAASPTTGDFKPQERQLVIKRRIFKNPVEKLSDPVEISLLYSQTLRDVLNENISVPIIIAAQLASLQIQVQYGELDEKEAQYIISQDMESMIPPELIPKDVGTISLIDQISEHYMGICELRISDAKDRYLAIAKKAPQFGVAMIQANTRDSGHILRIVFWPLGRRSSSFSLLKTYRVYVSYDFKCHFLRIVSGCIDVEYHGKG